MSANRGGSRPARDLPDIPALEDGTVELLRQGVNDSAQMREQLAARFKLSHDDQAWRKFVNNHAWALVRLQSEKRIHKVAPGQYELATDTLDVTPPIQRSRPVRDLPDISALKDATIKLLRRGVNDSAQMRERLAARFKLGHDDQAWRKFVNNHAWALVRLQSEKHIHKVASGQYELAAGEADATTPIQEDEHLPHWARVLVSAASHRNAKRWGAGPFQDGDLIALWKESEGRCMLTGLPFRQTEVGTGQACHPFAPSLDRIDPSQPYTRRNCRLVLQAVNFGQ